MNKNVTFGLLTSLIVVTASFFSSSLPDGLEYTAEKLGFLNSGVSGSALLKDYSIALMDKGALSTAVAGLIGIAVILGMARLFTELSTYHSFKLHNKKQYKPYPQTKHPIE